MSQKVIALDMGGTALKGALIDKQGVISDKLVIPTQGLDKDGVVGVVVNAIEQLKEKAGSVSGVGMGMPGPLNPFDGVVLTTPNLPFKEPFPIRDVVSEKVGLPVHINNDANLAMLGEAWLGAAENAQHAVMLTVGTGVGGGLLLNGELYMGSKGLGAELGHITISSDQATLGKFEDLASGTAITKQAQARIDKNIENAKQVEDLAHEGNEVAKEIYDTLGTHLGIAIASFINIFNPEYVVIGGGVSGGWHLFEKTMMEEINKRAFAEITQYAQVVPAKLGNKAGMLGAAKMAWDKQEDSSK